MMNPTSRRTFLKSSALGAMAVSWDTPGYNGEMGRARGERLKIPTYRWETKG
jgi:hypothetical protein